jgi:hypothetical protein
VYVVITVELCDLVWVVRALPAVTINVLLFFSFLDVINSPSFFVLKMTWCSKIYDIFNGWNEEDSELPPIESSKIKRIHTNFHHHELEDDNNNNNNTTIIQHDSPFLERSDSLTNTHMNNEQLYNNDYLNRY